LNTVHAIDTVNEQDQNEDKSNLHSILKFCYERALRDEGKKLASPGEWKRDDEKHEQAHLPNKEEENKTVVESHVDILFCR